MATTPTVYVICDQNCKFEGMTKEQILTAIMQAVESGEIKDVDAGFVTTIKTISGQPLKFFVGEQAAYDALTEEEKENLFAIITNDATLEGLRAAIKELQDRINNIEGFLNSIFNGSIPVGKANAANVATTAEYASEAEYAEETSRIKGSVTIKTINKTAGCSIKMDEMSVYVIYVIPVNSQGGATFTLMIGKDTDSADECLSNIVDIYGHLCALRYKKISETLYLHKVNIEDLAYSDGFDCTAYIYKIANLATI